jgi:hypothetical protein
MQQAMEEVVSDDKVKEAKGRKNMADALHIINRSKGDIMVGKFKIQMFRNPEMK